MRDFKPGRVKTSRKSARRHRPTQPAQAPRQVARAPRNLARAQQPRREPVPPRKNTARGVSGYLNLRNLARTAYVAAVCWLVVGIVVETIGLWGSMLTSVAVWGNETLSARRVAALAGFHKELRVGDINPLLASTRLVRQPRIKTADVRRYFPGGVTILLEERIPFARVRVNSEVIAVIDREGVVVALEGTNRATISAPLPLVLFSAEAPAPGQRLAGAELENGLRLIEEIEALRLAPEGGVSLDVNDPFGLILNLPARGHRLILPPEGLNGGLAKYLRLAPALGKNPEPGLTIDLRTEGGSAAERITLQHRRQ